MILEIIKTAPGDINFQLFEEVKQNVYSSDSMGLMQKDDLNLEFLDHCLVILQDGLPVGRLAVYSNPELIWKESKASCVGNFECVDSEAVAKLLLESAVSWSITNGFGYVLGPMNGSTWDTYRFSLHHNNPIFLSEVFQPLYYNELFVKNGFEPILHYHSKIEYNISSDNDKVAAKIAESALNGFQIRELSLERLEEELEALFPLIKKAFERNTLYTNISKETFFNKYKSVIEQLGTRYVMVAEKQGEIIAFVFAFPNLYNTTKKQLVFKTVARKFGKEYAGIGHVVALEVTKRAIEDGFQDAIHAFMIVDATSTEISNNFNSQPYSEYALYAKSLTHG